MLSECPISNHLRPGELVYDPFIGSGTTLIAAERLGRRCYAMEVDPRYAQCAIELQADRPRLTRPRYCWSAMHT